MSWQNAACNADVQAIGNAAWACAVFRKQHGGLVAGLSLAIERGQPLLSPQQLVNTAWALAKLDVASPETLQAICKQLVQHHVGYTNAQDIANLLWALARLDCVPQHELVVRLAIFNARISALMLWLACYQSKLFQVPTLFPRFQ